jgi:hypothetical protein
MDTSETVHEIELDGLRTSDLVLIQTAHNTYNFVVKDSEGLRGSLMGGAIREADTVVLGARPADNNTETDPLKLKTGSRAVFFIQAGGCLKRLITSAITKLIYMRRVRE